jgi:hypothetical protein
MNKEEDELLKILSQLKELYKTNATIKLLLKISDSEQLAVTNNKLFEIVKKRFDNLSNQDIKKLKDLKAHKKLFEITLLKSKNIYSIFDIFIFLFTQIDYINNNKAELNIENFIQNNSNYKQNDLSI